MASSNLITVVINNWNKFNPRADRGSYPWFRFQNDFFDDMELMENLSVFDVSVFVFLLCQCCKHNSIYASISCRLTSQILKIDESVLIKSLKSLESAELVKSTLTCTASELENHIIAIQRNETKRNNNPEIYDFTSAYESYPRKQGKAEGLARLEKQITSQADLDLFKQAVNNYAAHCKANKTEPQYIKQFSSFVGSKKVQPWRDWVGAEHKPARQQPKMRLVGDSDVQ